MTALVDACQALTEPWAEILPPDDDRQGYQVIEHKPRILMLADMIGSNSGRSTAGGSLAAERNLINSAAFDLWQKIDSQAKEALNLMGRNPHRELIDTLRLVGIEGDALRATNAMTEIAHSRLTGRVEKWRADIELLLDPPTKKEIIGACPGCGESRVYTPEGEMHALIAYYWPGKDLAADCHACGERWQGVDLLRALGSHLGAEADYVELRALGVG
ncbi:hypothetical protein [Agrococcus sp. DT81.2]|uniref:hypothetical protein n=1 Tax=Agrococcus sp. DT81.2 TaxID=3393414 RepID=UPI003CE542BD